MPWTVVAVRSLVDGIRLSIAEWRVRLSKDPYVGHARWGDAFPEFTGALGVFSPFWSFLFRIPSFLVTSSLPCPPLTILTGDYLFRVRQKGLPFWLLGLHALLSATTVFLVLLLPWHIGHPGAWPPLNILLPAVSSALAAALLIVVVGWAIWGGASAGSHHGSPGRHAVLYLWDWPFLWNTGLFRYQEKHPFAGCCLLRAAPGSHPDPDSASQRNRRGL